MNAKDRVKDILSKAIALDQAVQNAMNELTTDTYDENGEWNGFDITDPADDPAYIAISNLHAYLECSIPELEDCLPKGEILPVPAELRMDDCLCEIRDWAFANWGYLSNYPGYAQGYREGMGNAHNIVREILTRHGMDKED